MGNRKKLALFDTNNSGQQYVYFLSDIDPCYQVNCGPYKYCQVNEADMTHSCVCNNCTSPSSKNYYSQQVCDSNGVTHNSRCELDREICLGNTNATWVHNGPCAREYPSQSLSKKQISLSHKPL